MKKYILLLFISYSCYCQLSKPTPTSSDGIYYLNEREEAPKTNQTPVISLDPVWTIKEDTRPRFESYSRPVDKPKTVKRDSYTPEVDIVTTNYQQSNNSNIEELGQYLPFIIFFLICYAIYISAIKVPKNTVRPAKNVSYTSDKERFHLNMINLYEALVKSAVSECETEFLIPLAIQEAIISGKKVAEKECSKLANEFKLTTNDIKLIINKSGREIYNKYLETNPNLDKIFNT